MQAAGTLAVMLPKMTDKRLKIYYPSFSIKLDSRQLTLLILIALVVILHFAKSTIARYAEELDSLSVLSVVITFIYFIYFIISNLFAYESMAGFFSGYLIIENDKIVCDDKIYLFDEISKVAILNDYFKGNFNYNIRALEPKKSNGVKNYIEIYLKTGEVVKYFFLQTQSENLKIFSEELRTYYRFGKLNEQNYKNIINHQHYR